MNLQNLENLDRVQSQLDLCEAEAFWRQLLGGFTAPTPLVVAEDLKADKQTGDRKKISDTRENQSEFKEQEYRFAIATTSSLQFLAQEHQLTLHTLIQGAWAILLSRYSAETDVVFGDTINSNILPVRVSVSPEMSLLPWLKEIQAQWMASGNYRHTPLAKIQEWSDLHPETPLFESLIIFENNPDEIQLYPLTLIADINSELILKIKYDGRRFSDATIARILGHIKTLLEGMTADREQRLADLPLLTPEEKHQLLVEWNQTQVDYPLDICLHQLIEQQVERSPDAIALRARLENAVYFEDKQLTYRELNAKANQLARYLQTLGVGPEVLVGICVERSLEMVIGLLGILKAGGAYVPLDPTYPKERLAFMLEDAQTNILLTQTHLIEQLPEHQARVICLDEENLAIAQQSEENLITGVTRENLAYVIYTSGSTGKPKGAMNTHRGICNRLLWMQDEYKLTAADRILQKTPFSFDVSVWEFFWPLLTGARLVLAKPEGHKDSAYLVKLIAEEKITTLHFVPSMLQVFLEEENLETCNSLRYVMCSGEALPFAVQERFFARLKAELHNLYGPTEAAVDVTYWACQHQSDRQIVPIGRPIANIQLYVLDAQMQPVPIGVPGELHIGGVGVARGYLNRPELTEAKFIPNPFTNPGEGQGRVRWKDFLPVPSRRGGVTPPVPVPSRRGGVTPPLPVTRLYKTGDLVRYLPDGNIEYLGRIDHQVKIRGFRIELGEIEALISQHPAVFQTAVIAREDVPGDKRLVAYIVPQQDPTSTISQVRRFLKEHLPEYMVPSAFVVLDKLPLSPNGKLDRRALPAPQQARSGLEVAFVAPKTPIEAQLANIWSDILGIENLGIYDNFFELGGHSLLATRLLSQLRKAFQVDLSLRCLFEAPTCAQLAELIELQLQEKSALQIIPLVPVDRNGELPLSFAQSSLWFLDRLQPNSPLYNIASLCKLEGKLNTAALQQSLNEIIKRHEALRTSFVAVDGRPIQVIHSSWDFKLSIAEIPNSRSQNTQIENFLFEEAQQPFDLTQAPLMRATLLPLSEEEHLLLLVVHHIVADGWSIELLHREMATFYQSFTTGKPAPLAELPIQFADFAVWQRQWLQGEVLESQLSYWKQQLSGDLPVLQLPTDRPRPPVPSYRGARVPIALPASLSRQLKDLSHQEESTLFMILLAAFKTLLYRYTGQSDLIVGSAIANRNRVETEGIIGFFVNTLALRTDLSGKPSFQELLRRIREVALGAYANQDLPFQKLVAELQPERNLSQNPLFQVMFVLQNTPFAIALPELNFSPFEAVECQTARFDLTLELQETNQGIAGWFEYSTDLFDRSTIARMADCFNTLLEGIVANPNQPICELPLLTDREKHQLLVEWNQTGANFPFDVTIPQLFEMQVERGKDAIAVIFEDRQLTYQELNHRANKLAHHLQILGVGPEVIVGICVERSLEMVIGLLGILKAGGAYVPLDPTYPSDRLEFMLQDTQVSVLLTQQHLIDIIPQNKSKIIALDTDWETIAKNSDINPNVKIEADNLAYVIYTSGSTGRPKGVMVEHRAICHQILWRQTAFNLTEKDRVLQTIPTAFDPSVWQILGTLIAGSTLVVAPPKAHQDSAEMAKLIAKYQVTIADFVPSMLKVFLAEPGVEKCNSLRHVYCGGEALPVELVEQFKRLTATLSNQYGPTEACIDSTYWYCDRTDEQPISNIRSAIVPIGRPIANKQVYILDENLQPVPIGVPGELHVGGGLARGYLNRPELTEEKFIPDPFTNPGEGQGRVRWKDFLPVPSRRGGVTPPVPVPRLYKTGDLVRYLPDGNIEFLGRIDNQVKIRGLRIEVGEIEARLKQHPGVGETLVMAREDVPGEKRLVAYILANNSLPPTIAELRRFLQEHLPDYMVPSAFVLLDTLPLLPNGKVNRALLPAPDFSKPEQEGTFAAPRTPIEEVLAGIWTEVLGIENLGIHDNFFEIGGHSLLATQIVSRIRSTFEVELPLRRLFELPTIASLAQEVETALRASQGLPTLPIEAISQEGDLPLSFAQQRLWFIDRLEPGSSAYNIPEAIHLKGALNLAALEQALSEILRRHQVLRATFRRVEGQPVQAINPIKDFRLPIVDFTTIENPHSQIQNFLIQEAHRPFALDKDLLFRASLLQLGAEEHILLLTIHHIVCDGWSIEVLFQELAAHYKAFCSGLPSPVPNLPIQYADFARWQQQWLQGEVLESQLTYWKQHLADLEVLELPTDRQRPAVWTYRGARHCLEIPPNRVAALKALSRQQGVTLFMTLLAAFQTLLCRYSGQEDIAVGSPIAGRNRAEIERLIGFFVNTLVLRTDLSGNPSFRELLGRVRDVALGAYSHQDLPFEKLVEALQPNRDLSQSPLFQVMLVLQNASPETREIGELTLTRQDIENQTAKFDLTLQLQETANGINGWFEYNTDLFNADTIARMAEHFQTLLEAIIANPEQHLWELPLLTAAEEHQLLVEWNDTRTDYPRNASIPQLFEAQVELTPDAVAVIFKDERLTYRELNARANKLARYLQKLGVGSDVLVGICVERAPDAIVGILGILKAGGAYVPLDPAYPPERLAFMLEDTSVSVLLTQKQLDKVVPFHKAQVIYLDTDWEAIALESQENPIVEILPENLAYVMYTSGSTGQPKGVCVPHQGVVRLVKNTNYINLSPEEVFLQLAPICFDASTLEIWGSLLNGARLVLLPNSTPSLEELGRAIRQYQVTTLWLTAGLFHLMVDERIEDLKPVRQLLAGGDVLSVPHVRKLLKELPECKLIDGYGPTENTTFTCCYPIPDTFEGTNIPIGRAIANTQVYILDRYLKPVPIGVPGELYTGGAGLARGYLNRPDLTKEKFIPNPFRKNTSVSRGGVTPPVIESEFFRKNTSVSRGGVTPPVIESEFFRKNTSVSRGGVTPPVIESESLASEFSIPNSEFSIPNSEFSILNSEFLYKTGDLARYLPDGNIEFLGRIDNQVKIRGFRIELGEIEAVLSQHPDVLQTLVMSREDVPGNKHLAAYIVPHQNSAPTPAKLREFIKEKLPDYMVPSAFVLLDVLPLTPNGKVDRKSLPAPNQIGQEQEKTFVAPGNELEIQLTEIWEKVLGIQSIGVKDNFFELGGHSLLALRLFAQIEQKFAKNLPLSSIFQAPTIEQQASLITSAGWSPSWSSLVALQPSGSKPPLFCIHALGVSVLYYRDLANHLGCDRPFYALQPRGVDGKQAPLTRIPEMAALYIKEIKTIQPEGPYFLGGSSFGGKVAWEIAQQLVAQGEKVALLALFDTMGVDFLKRKPLPQRVFGHLNRLLQQGPAYIFNKVEGRIKWFKNRLNDRTKKKSASQFQPNVERPLTHTERKLVVETAHKQAERDYVLQVYPGRVTGFRAANQSPPEGWEVDPQMGWSKLAGGGLEIHEVPGNHDSMFREPHARVLAEKLRACLETGA